MTNEIVRKFLTLASAALILAGAASLGFSLLSFADAQSIADGLTSDGRAAAFTAEFHARRAVPLARIFGVILIVFGAISGRFRAILGVQMQAAGAAMRAEVVQLAGFCRVHWGSLGGAQKANLAVIFAAGIAMRLIYLTQPVRYDEAASYLDFASSAPLYLFYNYTPNNHILHTILMKITTLLFGNAEWVIRLPAFLSGCAGLVALYLLCVRMTGQGSLAMALAAVNPHLILYSTNGRGYTLAFLLLSGVLGACLELRNREQRLGLWAWIVVLGGLMLWTVPSMLYALLAALLVAALFSGCWREAVVAGSVAGFLTACLYLPVVLLSGWRALLANPWVTQTIKNVDVASGPVALLGQLYGLWTGGWPLALAMLAGAGLAMGAWRRSRALAVAALILATSLALAKLQGVTPPGRVFLYVLPLVLGAAGTGIAALPGVERVRGLLAIAILAMGGYGVYHSRVVLDSPETGANPEAEQAARFLDPYLRSGDRVLTTIPVSYPLFYWLRRLQIPGSYRHLESMPRPDRYILVLDRRPPRLPQGAPIPELVRQAIQDNQPAAIPIDDYTLGEPVFTAPGTYILFARRNASH